MEAIGYLLDRRAAILAEKIKQIWPDVKSGDTISTLVTAEHISRFCYNENLLAVLDHSAFGAALLSVWLDPNTLEPHL